MSLDPSNVGKFAHLDDIALTELCERNRERIQRLLAGAASVRVEQAIIRAEIKRRERELYL